MDAKCAEQAEFADFFRASWEPCLRAVLAVAGSPQLAEDQVAEAVRQGLGVVAEDPPPPSPKGMGGAHRAQHGGVVVAAPQPRTTPG